MPTSSHRDEGYIKFTCAHEAAPAPAHPWLHDLIRIRNDLRRQGLVGVLPDGVGFGNLSVRVAGSNRFIISASGTGRKPILGPEDFCEVVAFDIGKNRVACRGPLPASSESMSHGAVYAARPDANAVIHVHDRARFQRLRREGAPQTPAGAAFGTPELARAVGRLATTLPPVAVLVMAGHEDGLLAYGPDLPSARAALADPAGRARRE